MPQIPCPAERESSWRHSDARTTYDQRSNALSPSLDRQKKRPSEPASDDDVDDDPVGNESAGGVGAAANAGDHRPDRPSAFRGRPSADGSDGSGEEGDDLSALAQFAAEWVTAVPVSACGGDSYGSQNEPENSADVSAQMVGNQAGSVDGGRSASGRQNGIPSGTPAPREYPSRGIGGRGERRLLYERSQSTGVSGRVEPPDFFTNEAKVPACPVEWNPDFFTNEANATATNAAPGSDRPCGWPRFRSGRTGQIDPEREMGASVQRVENGRKWRRGRSCWVFCLRHPSLIRAARAWRGVGSRGE